MTTSVDYEVQIYERGDWQIASMSNDKDQALREARRIEEGLKRRETRVVEERHDENSGRTRSKIIYTTPQVGSGKGQAASSTDRTQTRKSARAGRATERNPIRTALTTPMKEEPKLGVLVVTLLVIITLGLVGIALLRYFSGLA